MLLEGTQTIMFPGNVKYLTGSILHETDILKSADLQVCVRIYICTCDPYFK